MKKLAIATSLILSLLASQAVLANPAIPVTLDESIETITVIAKSDTTDFDIFSLRHAEDALDAAMDQMVDNFVAADETSSLNDIAINTGS